MVLQGKKPDIIVVDYADLYDNAIGYFSQNLQKLPNLKHLDIQGVMYGHEMHKKLVQNFSHCTLLIDPPCSCMD